MRVLQLPDCLMDVIAVDPYADTKDSSQLFGLIDDVAPVVNAQQRLRQTVDLVVEHGSDTVEFGFYWPASL